MNFIIKNKIFYKAPLTFAVIFAVLFVFLNSNVAKASDWGYSDYGTSDWGYNDYNTSDWGYTDYETSDWGYNDYNNSDWGYNDYNYPNDTIYLSQETYPYPEEYQHDIYYPNNYEYNVNYDYYDPGNLYSYDSCIYGNCGNYYYNDSDYSNTTDYTYRREIYINDNDNDNDNDEDHDNDNDLEIECTVSDKNIEEGDYVTYEVEIDGGDSPYEIEWNGDIDGDDEEERVRFNREGRYEVEVTVEDDDGNRETDSCPTVRVDEEDDDDDDRDVAVISRTNNTPTGNLASVDSVFLSSLPYTGPQDTAKTLGFVSLLILWSAIITKLILNNKHKKAISSRVQAFKEANRARSTISNN